MNPYLSSSSLKSLARGQLLGRYRSVVSIFLLHVLCIMGINVLVTMVLQPTTLVRSFLYYIASYLVYVLSGFFQVGESYVYLKIANNQPVTSKDLFFCFKEDNNRTAAIQIWLAAFKLLALLPSVIYYHFFMKTTNFLGIDRTYTILLLLGILCSLWIQILFSQCFYLMLDFEEYSARQIMKKSLQLIKGSKRRLLYIMLSFLPLYLLGFLSCGIGFLWVIPYTYATYTNFYLDLIKKGNSL